MPSPATLRIDTDLGRLAEVRAFVRDAARERGADETLIGDLAQAVDEWVTNIVVHGYRGAGGPVEVVVERSGDAIEATVRDEAPAFDPATAPAFDPNLPLERRRFGGMGIHLIRDLAERFEHRDLPGRGNEVTIRVATRKTGGDR